MPFTFSKEVHDLAEDILQKHGLDADVLEAIQNNDLDKARTVVFRLPVPTDTISWKALDKVRKEDGPMSLLELVFFMNRCGELRLMIVKQINQRLAYQ